MRNPLLLVLVAALLGCAGTGADGDTSGKSKEAVADPPECRNDDECRMVSDCCTCEALPLNGAFVECAGNCGMLACEAMGMTDSDVACLDGRCAFDLSCDPDDTSCDAEPPQRLAGADTKPFVRDGCWGGCIPVGDCK